MHGSTGALPRSGLKKTTKLSRLLRRPGRSSPTDIDLLFSEGEAYYRLSQYEEAVHLFDIALGKEPGNGEILFAKGKALIEPEPALKRRRMS